MQSEGPQFRASPRNHVPRVALQSTWRRGALRMRARGARVPIARARAVLDAIPPPRPRYARASLTLLEYEARTARPDSAGIQESASHVQVPDAKSHFVRSFALGRQRLCHRSVRGWFQEVD